MNIGRFSVSNPVLVNIVMFVVIFLGIIFAFRLPKENFPEFPFYYIFINVSYFGVAAEDIERSVTIKIEDEMQNLEFLDKMSSITNDGLAYVQLEFKDGVTEAEFENILQEVRSRFANIDLPDDVGQESITDFSSSDFSPVISVIISGDITYGELTEHAARLTRTIEKIDGVYEVGTTGERERELRVEVNREKSDAYGVGLDTISQYIRETNLSIPGGTLRGADQSFLIRTDESVSSASELGDIVLIGPRGSPLYVHDVATVSEVYGRGGIIFRYNGQPGVSLSVSKSVRGDAVDIAQQVRAAVAEYGQSSTVAASNVQFNFFGDTSVEVARNIGTLGRNIMIGFLLVVLVLCFFVGFRNAFLTALGIPVSFGATFLILDAINFTLNSNVLFALVLVLGLIVDHAIVIIENAYRYNLAGKSRREAAILGVNQVIAPVVAATATTIAAFLPLAFLPGIIGRFLRVVPIVACITLTVSTLEAVFILPSHYADWGRKKAAVRNERRFSAFRDHFQRLLVGIYRHRLITAAVFVVLIIVSLLLFSMVGINLSASDEPSQFYVNVSLARGTSLATTERVMRQFEERLLPMVARDDVVSLSTEVGFQSRNDGEAGDTDTGLITIEIVSLADGRETDLGNIIDDARALVSDIVGTEQVRVSTQSGGPSNPPIVYRLYGDEFADLEAVSSAIQERLATYPQLSNIRDNFGEGVLELRVVVDKEEANRYGLSVQQIGAFLNDAVEGLKSGEAFIGGQEVNILVAYEEKSITRPEQLLLLRVPTSNGQLIPLSSVAHIETGRSGNLVRHLDQRREVTVTSSASNTANLAAINYDVQIYFYEVLQPQYPDIDMETGGQFIDFLSTASSILIVLGIGVFLIYVILGTQFRSYFQPFLIIMTIPFSFLGVILYLVISGTLLSTVVIYAAVALAGIAVNDSIVLISLINEVRAEGKSVYEAVISATTRRLRPILLTSLTTVCGLIPAALGLGGKSILWVPMANTIIFGLIFSTITTLIIVPCLYGLFVDSKKKRLLEVAKK